jgi:hypothetical protein
MRKLGLIAVVAATALLAGCGSTKTQTVTVSTASTTPPTSNLGGAPRVSASAASACLAAAGAAVRVRPAGRGTAVYATTRDGGKIGLLKGPNPSAAIRIAQVFSAGGWKVKPVKNDPVTFAVYMGTLTAADSALLSKCAK